MKKPQPTNLNEAVEVCTQMVNKVAHKWKRNHYWMFSDLQQAGLMGVCEAWERFDGSEHQADGYRFTTYAWWWIRLRIKEEAERAWDFLNHTAVEEAGLNENGYEMDDRIIELTRKLDRLNKEDRQLYRMRMDGYTFQEMSDELGAKSLHDVRNRLNKISERIEV